jgi:hypothetical protein
MYINSLLCLFYGALGPSFVPGPRNLRTGPAASTRTPRTPTPPTRLHRSTPPPAAGKPPGRPFSSSAPANAADVEHAPDLDRWIQIGRTHGACTATSACMATSACLARHGPRPFSFFLFFTGHRRCPTGPAHLHRTARPWAFPPFSFI